MPFKARKEELGGARRRREGGNRKEKSKEKTKKKEKGISRVIKSLDRRCQFMSALKNYN